MARIDKNMFDSCLHNRWWQCSQLYITRPNTAQQYENMITTTEVLKSHSNKKRACSCERLRIVWCGWVKDASDYISWNIWIHVSAMVRRYNKMEQWSLQWHHNECDGVWSHRCLDCFPNRLFWRRSKKTSKLHVTGFCEVNPQVTGGLSSQRASNAANVSIWWRHIQNTLLCVTMDHTAVISHTRDAFAF